GQRLKSNPLLLLRPRQPYLISHERNDKIKFPFFTGYWRGLLKAAGVSLLLKKSSCFLTN
ncbi:MAG TPA: hypothetical protein VJ279_06245, partial [Hanamia sp.]|nr:hypothetical protein [Hanamia sp.]